MRITAATGTPDDPASIRTPNMSTNDPTPSDDSPAARRHQMYERGATPAYACRADPRFSYCLYVPPSFDAEPAGHALVVAMHGSGRTMEGYRDAFRDQQPAGHAVDPRHHERHNRFRSSRRLSPSRWTGGRRGGKWGERQPDDS